jgi:short-subunit dehydrogenase
VKSIIVTGASSGIGKEAAITLAKAGYRIFGLARDQKKLADIQSQLALDQFVPIAFDITAHDTFEKVVSEIASSGQIFGLVNSAGYVEPGAIEDLTMDNLRAQFETNFFGLVNLTKQVLPHMMEHSSGRIVNISSMAGLVSLPLIGAYCATKHALEAISDALRMELWGTGIEVISINPGVIETNIHNVTAGKTRSLEHSRFANAYTKYLAEEPKGLPASAVGQAILHAVRSSNPKYRYLVGSGKEKTGVRLRPLLPDSVFYSQVARRILS